MKLVCSTLKPRKKKFSFTCNYVFFICSFYFFLFTTNFFSQTPSNISGLKLWLRSDTAITLNGSNVSFWGDNSGNLHNTIQTDINQQPLLIPNVLNNLPALRFNGDQVLKGGIIPSLSSSSLSIFIIASGATMSDPYNVLFDIGPYVPGGMWLSKNSNKFTIYSNNAIYAPTTGSLSSTGFPPSIFGYKKDFNVISESFINTVSIANSTNTSFTGSFVNGPFIIGGDTTFMGNSAGKWNGDIFEIILFDKNLSTSETKLINDYLVNRYTPFLNLGSDIVIPQIAGCIPSFSTTITANPDFQSYLWSNGNTTNQINVNLYGEYSVICKDVFGIEHYDTIKVIPSPKNFNYPSNNILCGNNSITWDTQLNKADNTFNWQDASNDSLFLISSSGQYYVNVTDNFGCVYNSNTVTITQDNFASSASLGPDTNLCAGNAISLKTGNQPGLNYVWNDNSTNNSLTINTSGQYSAIITNTNNCITKDTINVNIVGQAPTAAFINSIACKNNVISFTDNSTPPLGNTISSWFWNYGDGTTLADTSHFQNPNYTYADTGNFNVNLTITTNVGCKQVLIKNVHVAPKPMVNFNNIIACQNDSALFTNSITTFGYPTASYLWNFGDPLSGSANTSTLPNVKHLFSQQTIYPVKLVATNNVGCKDSITKNTNVKAQVTANFTTTTACTNTSVTFQDNSIAPAPNASNIRSWNFGTSTATGLTVTKTYSLAGTYPVTLTVNGVNGCISSITKSINVALPPIAKFTLPSICAKDTATAIDQSLAQNGSITSWTWKLDNTTFSSIPNPTLSPLATTAYSVKLTVVNSFNCKDSSSKTFNVYPLPAVDFTTNPTTYYYPNSPITFVPTNPSGILYNWTINNVLYTIQSPTVVITTAGTYTASLLQKNNFGCANTKTKIINVLNPFLDLALLDVKPTKNTNNYYSVEADIANFGTTPISSFNISYQISDAGSIQETWNGLLNPGEFISYQFTAKTLSRNTTEGNIVCVNIESVNTINDQNSSNNKLCVTENASNIVVSNPYPNPTDGDITLPIILNKDAEYKFELFNSLGQIILEETVKKGTTGLNLVPIPTSALRRGCYLLKITINDKTYIKKILKNSAE